MTDRALRPSPLSSGKPRTEVAEFLDQLQAKLPTPLKSAAGSTLGRLIFALDATASREAVWDRACALQGEMFEATAALGGLQIKLVFYRGRDECKASPWVSTAADLHRLMRTVSCIGGHTQIERVLELAVRETKGAKVNALVFVGDAMEEKVDQLCHLAGQLGALNTPVFTFHEGNDPVAASAFRQIANLSGGVSIAFDLAGIDRLRELLGAVAILATDNPAALEAYGARKGGEVLRLTSQLRR